MFGIALLLELLYYLFSRIILIRTYIKTYGNEYKGRPCYYNFAVIFTHSILCLFPSEMLIFFGYEEKSNEYEQGLLNFAWLRRIISCTRIILIWFSVSNLLAGEFVTLACFAQILYSSMLLIAICPQASSYDTHTWYRRAWSTLLYIE